MGWQVERAEQCARHNSGCIFVRHARPHSGHATCSASCRQRTSSLRRILGDDASKHVVLLAVQGPAIEEIERQAQLAVVPRATMSFSS